MKLRRALGPLIGTFVLLGVLFLGVFPTRTYLAQRSSISRAEEQLEVLGQQNAELEARARDLQRDAEIERLAREQYNLVKPGEEAYAVLPPPARPGEETPGVSAEAAMDEPDDRNLVERAWDAVSGLF